MSRLGSYKNTTFNESQKFLVLDPSTSSASLVLASELVAYITPKIGSVLAETTRLSAENTDYKVGEMIQTSGATAIGDGLASVFLVVAGGAGDFPMLNGNDLLVIVGDDALRAQLISQTAGQGASLVSMEGGPTVEVAVTAAEVAILNRVIRVSSRTEMKAYDVPTGYQFSLEEGGRSGQFVFKATDLSAKVSSDPQEGIYVAPDLDLTGASGAFLRLYNGLAGGKLLTGWFGSSPSVGFDNYTAFQATLDFAITSSVKGVEVGDGEYEYGTSLNFSTQGVTFIGVDNASTITGGGTRNCQLVWTGGATPMKVCSTSGLVFRGFSVENRGTATDWLELNSGSINNRYEDLYFVKTATHTYFSRSVIRSNGNRMGYSYFNHVIANSPAPKFIDIDGQGTSGGITPFSISGRCLFGANTADFTVVNIKDESLEMISMVNNTFNQYGFQLVILDTTDTPQAAPVGVFSFYNNEIDTIGDAAAFRYFKLTNVSGFSFDNNTVNAGGSKPYLGDLVNSNVTSFEGNSIKSVGIAAFDADDNSKITTGANPKSSRPVTDNVGSLITRIPYPASSQIDATKFDASKNEIVHLDLTDSSGHTINVDATSPQVINIGQVFTLVIRNVSGGVVAAGVFGATMLTTGASVAPANGFSRSYTFYWDGTRAIELSRGVGSVPNA
jgi:hypothetical protein